jgi:hypothetical protein
LAGPIHSALPQRHAGHWKLFHSKPTPNNFVEK